MPTEASEDRVAGPSTAAMPSSSLQGCIYGVSRNTIPARYDQPSELHFSPADVLAQILHHPDLPMQYAGQC